MPLSTDLKASQPSECQSAFGTKACARIKCRSGPIGLLFEYTAPEMSTRQAMDDRKQSSCRGSYQRVARVAVCGAILLMQSCVSRRRYARLHNVCENSRIQEEILDQIDGDEGKEEKGESLTSNSLKNGNHALPTAVV
jgi:hypothetical protein